MRRTTYSSHLFDWHNRSSLPSLQLQQFTFHLSSNDTFDGRSFHWERMKIWQPSNRCLESAIGIRNPSSRSMYTTSNKETKWQVNVGNWLYSDERNYICATIHRIFQWRQDNLRSDDKGEVTTKDNANAASGCTLYNMCGIWSSLGCIQVWRSLSTKDNYLINFILLIFLWSSLTVIKKMEQASDPNANLLWPKLIGNHVNQKTSRSCQSVEKILFATVSLLLVVRGWMWLLT